MIWLSWRQFRTQALVAAVALVLVATYLVLLGVDIRATYDGYLARCGPDCLDEFLSEYRNLLLFLDAGFILVPGLLGMFWGAPLVARELESGTHRLVWNQSVPRRRWLTVKLLVVGGAGMVAAGAVSLLLTWAASPVDHVAQDRFETLVFSARHVTPVAYALFAVVLGTVTGLVIRRTLPAMALTLAAFLAVQIAMPNLVRPNLMPPIDTTKPMTTEAINELRGLGGLTDRPTVGGLTIPDAWVTETSELLREDGRPLDVETFNACLGPRPEDRQDDTRFGAAARCLGELDLHVTASYQPNHRYWPFQWLESAIYLALAALLAAFGRWRIQRHVT